MNGIAWVVEIKGGKVWHVELAYAQRRHARDRAKTLRTTTRYETRVRKYIRQPEVRP